MKVSFQNLSESNQKKIQKHFKDAKQENPKLFETDFDPDFSKNQLIIATIYDLTQIDTWDQIVKMSDGVLNIGS